MRNFVALAQAWELLKDGSDLEVSTGSRRHTFYLDPGGPITRRTFYKLRDWQWKLAIADRGEWRRRRTTIRDCAHSATEKFAKQLSLPFCRLSRCSETSGRRFGLQAVEVREEQTTTKPIERHARRAQPGSN
jgi:hypothetical protein